MKKSYIIIAVSLTAISSFFYSCKKEENEPEKTVTQKLSGHWKTSNQYLQNNLVATADGSYLEFNTNDQGIDHKASDNSTGTFKWQLQNTDTEILFTDTLSAGGAWNGTYKIVSVTENKLIIKTNSILGEYKCELTK